MSASFDRLRPRHDDDVIGSRSIPTDHEGKRALFSDVVQPPTLGTAALTCVGCGERSVVSLPRLGRLSLPSLRSPVPGISALLPRLGLPAWRIWLTCPACGDRSWLRVGLH